MEMKKKVKCLWILDILLLDNLYLFAFLLKTRIICICYRHPSVCFHSFHAPTSMFLIIQPMKVDRMIAIKEGTLPLRYKSQSWHLLKWNQ